MRVAGRARKGVKDAVGDQPWTPWLHDTHSENAEPALVSRSGGNSVCCNQVCLAGLGTAAFTTFRPMTEDHIPW